jgi:hypothetical protein
MKSNALASLLTGAIIVCALISGWVFLRYYLAMKELQKLQGQYVFMNNARTAAQSLANEAIEYSKRNPSIDPILYQYQIKTRTATNAPAPPSTPSPRGGVK